MGLAHSATDPRLSAGWQRRALLVMALATAGAIAIFADAPLCPSAALLGIPCPGCGLTRATLALLRGDVHAALHLHPLVFVLSPLFVGFLGSALLSYVRGPVTEAARSHSAIRFAALRARLAAPLAWALLAATLGVWIARFFGAFGGPVPVHPLTHPPLSALAEHLASTRSSR